MCHVFPALLSSLAAIWLALNQSSDPRSFQLSKDDRDSSFIETGIDALSEPEYHFELRTHLNRYFSTLFSLLVDGDASISNSECSLRLRCGFDRLAALTTLGYPDVVRQTIRNLLEPVALSHPALLLAALAYVWPSLLSPTGNGDNMDIMRLLSSSPAGEFS